MEEHTDFVNPGVHPYNNSLAVQAAARVLSEGLQADATHTPEEATSQAEAYVPVLAPFAVTSEQAGEVLRVVRSASQVAPTTEQRQAWREQSRAQVVSAYGPANAAQVMRDTAALIARSPKLQGNLQRLGIAEHPDVVKVFADRAQLARRSGRLK